ncbi:DUF421 domain-containing protein [Lentibacillus cibarius]|uniref:DUF421 domain-containing protein n=1 Tax=Lentibacillus cibarius TaxID=2583219 RepID=A0A5S3QN34_9BACI|nr:YetF domain-containing protein [Lentibacillus cibarius]TMN23147.1 DUF421 domain-containing protein [Lentibacillus cibarius]
MLLFLGKLIALYFVTIVAIRLMGKSAFAQLTAHDLTGLFFVISLAAGPVVSKNFTHTIVGLIVIGLVHIGFSRLMLINWLNRIFTGKPTIVIKHGKLVRANLKGSKFSLTEILSEVREKGYPDITAIDYALIEPSGGISVIPKQGASPITPDQLGIEADYQGMPLAVVIEGKIQYENLAHIDVEEQWLRKKLEKEGYADLDEIFYAALTANDYSLIVDTGKGDTS